MKQHDRWEKYNGGLRYNQPPVYLLPITPAIRVRMVDPGEQRNQSSLTKSPALSRPDNWHPDAHCGRSPATDGWYGGDTEYL